MLFGMIEEILIKISIKKKKITSERRLNFTHWFNSFRIFGITLAVLSPFPGCDAAGCHAFLADSWNKAFSSD